MVKINDNLCLGPVLASNIQQLKCIQEVSLLTADTIYHTVSEQKAVTIDLPLAFIVQTIACTGGVRNITHPL